MHVTHSLLVQASWGAELPNVGKLDRVTELLGKSSRMVHLSCTSTDMSLQPRPANQA